MNDVTPTRYMCRPAVRLSLDLSEVEEALQAFGNLENHARAAISVVYQRSLGDVYIKSLDHVYHSSEKHGDFIITFKITNNLFSPYKIEHNPDGEPIGISDGFTFKILEDGSLIDLPKSPLNDIICNLPIMLADEVVHYSDAFVADSFFTICAPPEDVQAVFSAHHGMLSDSCTITDLLVANPALGMLSIGGKKTSDIHFDDFSVECSDGCARPSSIGRLRLPQYLRNDFLRPSVEPKGKYNSITFRAASSINRGNADLALNASVTTPRVDHVISLLNAILAEQFGKSDDDHYMEHSKLSKSRISTPTRAGDLDAVYVEGLPTDLAHARIMILAMTHMMGKPFNYDTQNGGALVMELKPVKGSVGNTNSTREDFAFHTDDAAIPRDARVEWLQLYGIVNPPNTLTGFAPTMDALNDLKASGTVDALVKALGEPRFRVRFPVSFGLEKEVWSDPCPVIEIGEDGDIETRFPSYAIKPVRDDDFVAHAAIAVFLAALERQVINVPLDAGCFLAFNNNRGAHKRGTIGEANKAFKRPPIGDGTVKRCGRRFSENNHLIERVGSDHAVGTLFPWLVSYPAKERTMHKTYIDDSMYPMYTNVQPTNRATSAVVPPLTPH